MNPSKNIAIKIGTATIHLVRVEGGIFQMGGNEFDWEQPIHQVTVPSFYLSKYLVTQELYQEVKDKNPSFFKGANRPVEEVSWEDSKEFIVLLNKHKEVQLLTGQFRLPTESEWEYAAKGGKYSQGYKYCGSDDLKQVGWNRENSGNETKSVGLLLPNELGIHDMSGNVYEWCEDDWHESYEHAPDDGSAWIDAPSRGANRVVRGGSCFTYPVCCRPAYRLSYSPDDRIHLIGFRLVFSPSQASPPDNP